MKNKKLLGLAASLLIAGEGNAQLVKPENGLEQDYRLGFGYSGNFEGSNRIQTTIGAAPKRSYYLGAIPPTGQFYDNFRLYDIHNFVGNNDIHTSLIGAKSPSFAIGNIENKFIAFGALDSINGAGIESTHTIDKKITLTLNGEYKSEDIARRIGGALSYNITDNMQFTLAYDNVNSREDIEQYYANIGIDIDKRNTVGITGLTRKFDDNSSEKGLGFFWNNYTDEAKWGTRAFANYSWNEQNKEKRFGGNLIIAQTPTTSKYGAMWAVGRGVGNDDIYNLSVIPLSVSLTEQIRLFDRAKKGFSFEASADYSEIRGKENTSFYAGIGHIKFYKPIKAVVGLSGGIVSEHIDKGDFYSFDYNMIYRGFQPKGLWSVFLGTTVPLNKDDARPTFRIGGNLVF